MAEIVELVLSRPGRINEQDYSKSEWKRQYHVTGTANEATVIALVQSTAPTTMLGLPRYTIDIDPLFVDTADGADEGLWDCMVSYRARNAIDITGATASFAFDTTGGTQHVVLSLETIANIKKTADSDDVRDYLQLIGWNGEEPEGVDIVVPKCSFTLKRQVPLAKWNPTYYGKLYSLTGKINDAIFGVTINATSYSYAAGEVLFLGARGDEKLNQAYVDVEYLFAVSMNKTFGAGDMVGFPAFTVKGWEYMWVTYEEVDQAGAISRVGRPKSIHVERLYDTGDFQTLEP